MKKIDFSKWVIVAVNDNTGLGSMAEEMKACLQIGKHLVCRSKRLTTKPINEETDFLFDANSPGSDIEEFLKGSEGIICLEYVTWHPELVSIAKKHGIKVVCVPMWEWFRGTDVEWKDVDLFVCPNQKAIETVQSYGYQNSVLLPWSLDLSRLPKRTITGKAKKFIHNVGLIDDDDRKGTFATIKAFKKVKNPDIELVIRVQKEYKLPKLDSRMRVELGDFDEGELYQSGDVAIQPSKMEGLGFMVLEPVCCGIPTITTNILPIKEYVQQPELWVKPKWFKRKSFSYIVAKIKHAFMYEPSVNDLANKIRWCAENDLSKISAKNREWAEERFGQKSLQQLWGDGLKKLFN